MTPRQVVDEYLRRMRAGDPAVAELFAEAAVLSGLGRRVAGRTEIAEFYRSAQQDGGATPTPLAIAESGDRVFAELSIEVTGGLVLHVVDVFVVEAGEIVTLTYFLADEPRAADP